MLKNSVKAHLDESLTKEGFGDLLVETRFYLQILRVKLESNDPQMREEAFGEIQKLRNLLERQAAKLPKSDPK